MRGRRANSLRNKKKNLPTGVLAMRWNVVIGGQLFSKSLRGVMGYKLEFAGVEGWFMGLILLSLPFIILTVLVKLFLSERLPSGGQTPTGQTAAEIQAPPQ